MQHNIIIGVIAVVFGLAILLMLYRIWTYKPTMGVNSWGDPDAGEACGYCCLGFIATIALVIAAVLLYAYLISILL